MTKLYSVFYREHQCDDNTENLKSVVEEIVEEIIERSNCIVFVTDSVYQTLVNIKYIKGLSDVSKYEV